MKRFIAIVLMMLVSHFAGAQASVDDHFPRSHLLFTDPFEDTDDLFAILVSLKQALDSKEPWYIITANEILDENGQGFRAMALSQWLINLASDESSPLLKNNREKLKSALQSKRISIIQGLQYEPFQRDFDHHQQTGQGDTHFYAMSLAQQFKAKNRQAPFMTLQHLREKMLTNPSKLSIVGIASAKDIAAFFSGTPALFEDGFVGNGDAQAQIAQAKAYYQLKLSQALASYHQSQSAQSLVSRTEQLWQMSGGLQGQEEYNERLSRIANDYLNRVFQTPIHGITPINTTALLHPMLEYLKPGQTMTWPIDARIAHFSYLEAMWQEHLFGSPPLHMPGYYDKFSHLESAHTLNHDLLALIESGHRLKIPIRCQMAYQFNAKKQRVKRSYTCNVVGKDMPTCTNDDCFTLHVSPETQAILQESDESVSARFRINQTTDRVLTDALYVLFGLPYDRISLFDFDGTITVDESFTHPIDDPQAVFENTKTDIDVYLRKDGAIFAINSFIDAPDNVLVYLQSIFHQPPKLLWQKPYQLFNEKRGKEVVAFYLSKYTIEGLPTPIYMTNLPRLNPERDPETGEKNIEYHMAREVLASTGKNLPSKIIVEHLVDDGVISDDAFTYFYDDSEENAQFALMLTLLGHTVQSYLVTAHIKPFVANPLNSPGLNNFPQLCDRRAG
ncbi:hypothetical protein [Legionella sp. W05-934-2]|uniref:hypothetical protein n=1 Tax=Legionella sp. W05-934-2 TaxID=1198649 RepID=UPI003462D8E1